MSAGGATLASGRRTGRGLAAASQPVGRHHGGHADDLHGGARRDDRQRRPAAHRRQHVGQRRRGTWVLTSYLVSNAIVLPLSGWFSSLFGRKRFYMACVVLFTVGSLLCGLAPSLGWLVFFRVLPGGRRRGTAADVAGDPGREFSAGQAGPGHGGLRHGRRRGADRRADPRRMDHRQLHLAVDLLHQHPRGHPLDDPDERPDRRPAVPAAPQPARPSASTTSGWACWRWGWAPFRWSSTRASARTGSGRISSSPSP